MFSIEIYNFIDIEAIQDIVHIIPRFNSNNDYLVKIVKLFQT